MSVSRAEACTIMARASHDADASAQPLRLQARVSRGEAGMAVVAPPHPAYGGTIDNPVVARIERAFAKVGQGALSFNWRGVERSEGHITDELTSAVLDYTAALEHVAALAPPRLACAGYSFGAGTALLAARDDARVQTLVLVAPPVGMLRGEDVAAFRGKLVVVVGDDDEYAPLPALHSALAARSDVVLEVLRGADHFFHFGGLSDIEAKIAAHLPP